MTLERFNEGDLVIVIRGRNVPITTIGIIIDMAVPVYVNATKFYRKFRIEDVATQEQYITYAEDLQHYEPLGNTEIEPLKLDMDYEYERGEYE